MEKGKILLLNGVTGAGKSTLAKALQAGLDEPYYYVALDTFNEHICPFGPGNGKFTDLEIMNRAVEAMHCLIRDFSDRGCNVVVDHILCDYGGWFYDCVDALQGYPVLYVRVSCSRDELFRRAKQRGYSSPARLGQIDSQLGRMRLEVYDLAVDTQKSTVQENVERIKAALAGAETSHSFAMLKRLADERRSASR